MLLLVLLLRFVLRVSSSDDRRPVSSLFPLTEGHPTTIKSRSLPLGITKEDFPPSIWQDKVQRHDVDLHVDDDFIRSLLQQPVGTTITGVSSKQKELKIPNKNNTSKDIKSKDQISSVTIKNTYHPDPASKTLKSKLISKVLQQKQDNDSQPHDSTIELPPMKKTNPQLSNQTKAEKIEHKSSLPLLSPGYNVRESLNRHGNDSKKEDHVALTSDAAASQKQSMKQSNIKRFDSMKSSVTMQGVAEKAAGAPLAPLKPSTGVRNSKPDASGRTTSRDKGSVIGKEGPRGKNEDLRSLNKTPPPADHPTLLKTIQGGEDHGAKLIMQSKFSAERGLSSEKTPSRSSSGAMRDNSTHGKGAADLSPGVTSALRTSLVTSERTALLKTILGGAPTVRERAASLPGSSSDNHLIEKIYAERGHLSTKEQSSIESSITGKTTSQGKNAPHSDQERTKDLSEVSHEDRPMLIKNILTGAPTVQGRTARLTSSEHGGLMQLPSAKSISFTPGLSGKTEVSAKSWLASAHLVSGGWSSSLPLSSNSIQSKRISGPGLNISVGKASGDSTFERILVTGKSSLVPKLRVVEKDLVRNRSGHISVIPITQGEKAEAGRHLLEMPSVAHQPLPPKADHRTSSVNDVVIASVTEAVKNALEALRSQHRGGRVTIKIFPDEHLETTIVKQKNLLRYDEDT